MDAAAFRYARAGGSDIEVELMTDATVIQRRPPGRPRLSPLPIALESADYRGVPDLETTRFVLADMKLYGDWLYRRFEKQWPGKPRQWWEGKINSITGSNEFLFIKNEYGVLLMQAPLHVLDGKSRATEVFAWSLRSRPPAAEPERLLVARDDAVGIQAMASLYHFAREWMHSRGALYMIAGVCTDMPISLIEAKVRGECADWVVIK